MVSCRPRWEVVHLVDDSTCEGGLLVGDHARTQLRMAAALEADSMRSSRDACEELARHPCDTV